MSKSGAGGARGGGGGRGAAGVSIPDSVRQTIHSIREITGKQHSDEDIFSVLQDCSMDPNDTAQKLLYLDIFHEVKRRRDKKKEISGTVSRGPRSGRGNHSAKHAYHDAVVGRNSIHQRENGVHHTRERGSSTPLPIKEKIKISTAVPERKASTFMRNGPSSLSNGRSSPGCGPQSPSGGDVSDAHNKSDDDITKLITLSLLPAATSSAHNEKSQSVIQVGQGKPTSPTITASSSGVYSSASDPILAPSMIQNPGAVGAIKLKVRSQRGAVEHDLMQGNAHSSDVESGLPRIEKEASISIPSVNKKMEPALSKAIEINELSQTPQPSLPTHNNTLAAGPTSAGGDTHLSQESDAPLKVVSSEDARAAETAILLKEQTISNGHVTFPEHFKVPEALKSGLTFGSFDANSRMGTKYNNGNGWETNSTCAVESSYGTDESAKETSSSDQSISSPVVDHPESESPQLFDKAPKPEANIALTTEPKSDKPSQEMIFSEGHQNAAVPIAPNYGLGIMPPLQAGHFVQFEGHEAQNENPTTSSSPSPTRTPPVQNPIAASTQPVLFRPPYLSNYFPYGQYFNPYFYPPMHQFLTHNGLPQQTSSGNAYLGPTAAAPGVKFPIPQFKPGTSTGNPTTFGNQSLYGTYGSSPVAFNPNPAVTSGNSASNGDLSASQFKESEVYATGPLNDTSAWISPSGQDVSSFHLNPIYHLTPQGQHLTFSPAQAGHGPFPGIYAPVQSLQTIGAAPSTVNPLLQQSQAVSAAVETMGHPATAYQQTQLAQMNWNSAY